MSYTKSKITRISQASWDYWQVSERTTNGTGGFEIHYSDDGECITDHVYTKEDANLIAAAPLMLETLKYIQDIGGLGLEIHSHIRNAIKAANGGKVRD